MIWWRLGLSYLYNNQYDEAIKSLKKSIELNPNYTDSWSLLGLVYYNNVDKRYKEAKECFLKAIELDPNNIEIRNMLDKLNNI